MTLTFHASSSRHLMPADIVGTTHRESPTRTAHVRFRVRPDLPPVILATRSTANTPNPVGDVEHATDRVSGGTTTPPRALHLLATPVIEQRALPSRAQPIGSCSSCSCPPARRGAGRDSRPHDRRTDAEGRAIIDAAGSSAAARWSKRSSSAARPDYASGSSATHPGGEVRHRPHEQVRPLRRIAARRPGGDALARSGPCSTAATT